MRISPEVEIALSVAATEAARRRHEFMTLEHLLYALLLDEETSSVVKHAGGDPAKLRKSLEEFFLAHLETVPESGYSSPTASLGVQRVLRRALTHVESAGKEQVKGANILVAMFREEDSYAVTLLEQSGVTRLDVVSFLSHGVSKTEGDGEELVEGDGKEKGGSKKKSPLKAFTVNLNEEAKAGRIDPLIGRLKEVDRIVHILARRKKNNPMLVGDAGVGKTAIVEGLGRWPSTKAASPPRIKSASHLRAGHGCALGRHASYRGQFEERSQGRGQRTAVKGDPNAILFIDEIHTIVGAGATSGGSDRRVQSAQAGAGGWGAALHRLAPPSKNTVSQLRARPRPGAPFPARSKWPNRPAWKRLSRSF